MNASATSHDGQRVERLSPVVARPMSRRMRLSRATYAGAILLVPPTLSIWAFARARTHGVGLPELVPLVAMYLLSQLGITLGYHRYASHRAFEPVPWVGYVLLVCGSMAGQGPVIHWASDHRRHHHFADRPGDPHAPTPRDPGLLGRAKGMVHAHVGWTFGHALTNTLYYCRDLLGSPMMRRAQRLYLVWLAVGLLLPAVFGGLLFGSASAALSGLLWGGFVRLFVAYHATLSINSLGHSLGWRAFDTRDTSRNNRWLAVLTLGEGLHNNHHAFPAAARFSRGGLQWDLGGQVLQVLSWAGLVRISAHVGPSDVGDRSIARELRSRDGKTWGRRVAASVPGPDERANE